MRRLARSLSAFRAAFCVRVAGGYELKHPWTVLFVALSTFPGLALLLLFVFTGKLAAMDAASAAWIAWSVLVLMIVGFWTYAGMRTAEYVDRRREGRCVHCGYDLQAKPGLCPECGTLVTFKSAP